MRQRTGVLLLTLLAGCCPSVPPAEPGDAETGRAKTEASEVAEARLRKARLEEAEAWKKLGDYYGPPAPIVLDPPPVPPEIMGPTPLDRLPKK